MDRCPHCGGESGAVAKTIIQGGYLYFWDGEMTADHVEQHVVRETIPRCLDCGKRVPGILVRAGVRRA